MKSRLPWTLPLLGLALVLASCGQGRLSTTPATPTPSDLLQIRSVIARWDRAKWVCNLLPRQADLSDAHVVKTLIARRQRLFRAALESVATPQFLAANSAPRPTFGQLGVVQIRDKVPDVRLVRRDPDGDIVVRALIWEWQQGSPVGGMMPGMTVRKMQRAKLVTPSTPSASLAAATPGST
jgi:hypothetical protein